MQQLEEQHLEQQQQLLQQQEGFSRFALASPPPLSGETPTATEAVPPPFPTTAEMVEQAQDLSASAVAVSVPAGIVPPEAVDQEAAGTILTIPEGSIEVTFLPTGKGELKEIPGLGTVLESTEDGRIIRYVKHEYPSIFFQPSSRIALVYQSVRSRAIADRL